MTEQLIDFKTAVLARKKGFDEPCRNCWMSTSDKAVAINAPSDEELVGGILNIFIKYKGDFKDFLKKAEGLPKPLYNSRLPDMIYSRPTQDLLERWLREKHRIMPGQYLVQDKGVIIGFASIALEMDKIAPTEPLDKTLYNTFEEAREVSLFKALNLLP